MNATIVSSRDRTLLVLFHSPVTDKLRETSLWFIYNFSCGCEGMNAIIHR